MAALTLRRACRSILVALDQLDDEESGDQAAAVELLHLALDDVEAVARLAEEAR